MFDKADDELIQRLIQEAEAIIEKELQKHAHQDEGEDVAKDKDQKNNNDSDVFQEDLSKQIPKKSKKTNKSVEDKNLESVERYSSKRRRGLPKKMAQKDTADADKVDDDANASEVTDAKKPVKDRVGGEMTIKETVLEFVEREDGILVLQEVGGGEEPMVTIAFSEQVKAMIGTEEIQNVGQNMIHAAIATVMQRQMNAWHAHVYDEKPTHYS